MGVMWHKFVFLYREKFVSLYLRKIAPNLCYGVKKMMWVRLTPGGSEPRGDIAFCKSRSDEISESESDVAGITDQQFDFRNKFSVLFV